MPNEAPNVKIRARWPIRLDGSKLHASMNGSSVVHIHAFVLARYIVKILKSEVVKHCISPSSPLSEISIFQTFHMAYGSTPRVNYASEFCLNLYVSKGE